MGLVVWQGEGGGLWCRTLISEDEEFGLIPQWGTIIVLQRVVVERLEIGM